MKFLNNLFNSNITSAKTHSEKYIDLGNGLPWFNEYRNRKNPPLREFFGLDNDNQIKIDAIIGKTAYYQTPKGRRWAVVANYFSKDKQESFTFYCPEFEYDPTNDYKEGTSLIMYVDKDDFSKYEMPIY